MKLVILDRDGVINEDSDAFVKTLDEWVPIDGSIDAIARLCEHGFTVAIATNQSGIGRGLIAEDDLDAMHGHLLDLVREAGGDIATIAWCPHKPEDLCDCRKPQSGLFDQIANTLGCDLEVLLWWATACAICRQVWRAVVFQYWCAPAKVKQRKRKLQTITAASLMA